MNKTLPVIMTAVVIFVIAVFLNSAFAKEMPIKTIGDLAYGENHNFDSSALAYVLENEQYVPFIVLTNDYNGNTLLLRKDVLDAAGRINDYSALYKDSEIDKFLNTDYLSALCGIQSFVLPSEILITDESSLGISGSTVETIERKVFLLSCAELGLNSTVNCGLEGTSLRYFKDDKNQTAYQNGTPYSWWLRTPNTYYLSCTYVIGSNGKLGSTNAYDNNGIRPAFCVASDLEVELSQTVIPNQSVYVFSCENQ